MEEKLRRYNINRLRPRHGHKYTKYNMYGYMYKGTSKQHLKIKSRER